MELLGIDPNSIGEDDNLAGMGIDSMQVVEVRARIQRALGRPIPLEEVRSKPLPSPGNAPCRDVWFMTPTACSLQQCLGFSLWLRQQSSVVVLL